MNDALASPRTKDMTGIIIKSNHLTLISKLVKLIALHSSSIPTLMMRKNFTSFIRKNLIRSSKAK